MTATEQPCPAIDASLVAALVSSQFTSWAQLPVAQVLPGGSDHRTFRLGDALVARLPSSSAYATQVEKEHRWLPMLASFLPLEIPQPVALGEPGHGYPWHWSVRKWIEGDTATQVGVHSLTRFAEEAGGFLAALHRIDSQGGPSPGHDNFFRGGQLKIYDEQARTAIRALEDKIDTGVAMRIWQAALASEWQGKPQWVHGDFSAGNLLVRGARLRAVIDFGSMAVGDPACDLTLAWTFLTPETRPAFRSAVRLDGATWKRAHGWALWKASIVAAGMAPTNRVEEAQAWRTISELLGDC